MLLAQASDKLMCGIAGAIEPEVHCSDRLETIAQAMIGPLIHRGPDSGDIWTDSEFGIVLAHRRLSIIDLSSAGAQPMVSESQRYVLSYNGEIYNTEELRANLGRPKSDFRGHCDTEVLLEACAAWGVETAVCSLIGMFAFALWDRLERCLWLVRDRIGIKPLYYSATPRRFTFASELTGLSAHPNFQRTISYESVDAFLALDYIPAPHSIFRDAQKLEPGTILRVTASDPASVEIKPYWTLAKAVQNGLVNRFSGSLEEAKQELEWLLTDAVKRRMVSDVPLGAFLSGGIDSSAIVALMQKESPRPVNTFTIGFPSGVFDEAPYAKAIAKHLGTDHNEHYVTHEEIRENGPAILGHHDEPFAEPSVLQTWILCNMARQSVKVVQTGDGGDELFGGYPRHVSAQRLLNHSALQLDEFTKTLVHRIVPALPKFLRRTFMQLPFMVDDCHRSLTHQEIRILLNGLCDPEQIHYALAPGTFTATNGKYTEPAIAINSIERWLKEAEGLSASERQQYIDTSGYLPDYLLTRFDRISMGVALELRVPILDHRIIEFAFRIPSEYKVYGSVTKRILRKVLNNHVPCELFEREKRGFGAPMKEWIGGPLRNWVEDILCPESISKYNFFDSKLPNKTLRRLRSGKLSRRDFRIIALAAWCDRHL